MSIMKEKYHYGKPNAFLNICFRNERRIAQHDLSKHLFFIPFPDVMYPASPCTRNASCSFSQVANLRPTISYLKAVQNYLS